MAIDDNDQLNQNQNAGNQTGSSGPSGSDDVGGEGPGDYMFKEKPAERADDRSSRMNAAKAFYRAMYAGEDVSPEEFGMANQQPTDMAPNRGPCQNCKSLEAQLSEYEAKANDAEANVKRLAADFENYRKRVDREREEFSVQGAQKAIEAILPALDDLDRAKGSLTAQTDPKVILESFNLIYSRFAKCLEVLGVKTLEVIGQPFDPRQHEPVQEIFSSKHPDGTVIQELRRGYSFKDKVLRPTLVNVSTTTGGPEELAAEAAREAAAAAAEEAKLAEASSADSGAAATEIAPEVAAEAAPEAAEAARQADEAAAEEAAKAAERKAAEADVAEAEAKAAAEAEAKAAAEAEAKAAAEAEAQRAEEEREAMAEAEARAEAEAEAEKLGAEEAANAGHVEVSVSEDASAATEQVQAEVVDESSNGEPEASADLTESEPASEEHSAAQSGEVVMDVQEEAPPPANEKKSKRQSAMQAMETRIIKSAKQPTQEIPRNVTATADLPVIEIEDRLTDTGMEENSARLSEESTAEGEDVVDLAEYAESSASETQGVDE